MSQGQPRRPEGKDLDQPIKIGEVFHVAGELATQPEAPRDAALLQSAEQLVLGQTQRGGPAAAMQSAAALNARAGHIGKGQISGPAADAGVTVTEAELPGRPGAVVVTESVGGQVVGKFVAPGPVAAAAAAAEDSSGKKLGQDAVGAVTIGRAMEVVAAAASGDKAVDQSDAAAVQAAEMCATGSGSVAPGGLAAAAQAAADHNARVGRGEDRVKLRDVLANAREKLPADKGATREDAERVVSAEMRNKPDMVTTPGGVADAVATAARLNLERS